MNPSLLRLSLAEIPSVLGLAFPIVVGLAAATLIGAVDTVMIAPLGTEELAAASLAGSATIVLYSALYGVVTVVGIFLAQAAGAQDGRAVSSGVRHGMVLAAAAGTVATLAMIAAFPLLRFLGQPESVLTILLPYWIAISTVLIPFTVFYVLKGLLDAIGHEWLGAGLCFVGVLANVPLNYLLIHGIGPWNGLGLLGAGLASLGSQVLTLIVGWLYWRRVEGMAPYRARGAITRAALRAQWCEAWPIMAGCFGEGASYALAGLMLGWFGTAALAAYQIVNSIGTVIYMLPLGMAAAVGVRIGQAIGTGQAARLRPIGLTASALVTGWMLLATMLIVVFRGPTSALLSDDPAVIEIAVGMFLVISVLQIADGLQSIALGALRGMMDNRVPTAITVAAYWPIALPLTYLLSVTLGIGPNGVWLGYGLGIFLAAGIVQWRLWRLTAPGAAERRIAAGAEEPQSEIVA